MSPFEIFLILEAIVLLSVTALIVLRHHVCFDAVEWSIGTGIFGTVVALMIWGAAASIQSEIDPEEYRQVGKWVEEFPSLQAAVDRDLQDDMISNFEWQQIKKKYEELEAGAAKEALKK